MESVNGRIRRGGPRWIYRDQIGDVLEKGQVKSTRMCEEIDEFGSSERDLSGS